MTDKKLKKVTLIDHSSATTTEEYSDDEEMVDIDLDGKREIEEELVREIVREWLALHGRNLFALEASKFLANEGKRKKLKKIR